VKSQSPAGGETAPKGSKVVINVTQRPEQAAVPNVVGMTRSSAESTITGVGFAVNVINQVTTPANVGKVLSQSPTGGTLADKGSTVTITVGIAGP
jgi:serine/threonine-protein kinase